MCDAKFLDNRSRVDTEPDESLEGTLQSVWIRFIIRALHEGRREKEKFLFFIPDECSWIPEDIGRRSSITEDERRFLERVFYITDIIEIDFYSSILSPSPLIRLRIISESNKSVIIIWVKIGRIPWHLQFTK